MPLNTILERNQKCDFLKSTRTLSNTGATTVSFPTALKLNVPCWKQGASSRLRTEYASRKLEITEVIYTAENPGVSEGDCIRIGLSRYLIQGVKNEAGLEKLFRFDVRIM